MNTQTSIIITELAKNPHYAETLLYQLFMTYTNISLTSLLFDKLIAIGVKKYIIFILYLAIL